RLLESNLSPDLFKVIKILDASDVVMLLFSFMGFNRSSSGYVDWPNVNRFFFYSTEPSYIPFHVIE
uniref:Uncharacterized protein n=1 Tax=Oryza brachyantha TaxID=4533 RepID=J3KUF0_ORYBR